MLTLRPRTSVPLTDELGPRRVHTTGAIREAATIEVTGRAARTHTRGWVLSIILTEQPLVTLIPREAATPFGALWAGGGATDPVHATDQPRAVSGLRTGAVGEAGAVLFADLAGLLAADPADTDRIFIPALEVTAQTAAAEDTGLAIFVVLLDFSLSGRGRFSGARVGVDLTAGQERSAGEREQAEVEEVA